MNTFSKKTEHERIEDEAALWAARLRGGMTDTDRAELATWLDADPEHGWVLSHYRQLSGQIDEQLAAATDALAMTEAAARRRHWRVGAIVCAAAAAILLGFLLLNRSTEQFSTKLAERHLASLSDGSRIELNARTAVEVEFTRDARRVRLTQGEALFTVAKDPARPFIVETPSGSVRVTGTTFNVRAARAERVEVTVLEGNVRVRASHAANEEGAALVAGRRAIVETERVTVHALPAGSAEDAIAWRQGHVVFDDTPLSDALDRFASYHAIRVTIDPAVADLRLGGRYGLDDLSGLLETIERVLPVSVVRVAADVRVVPASR